MKNRILLIIGLIFILAAGLSAQERLAEPNDPKLFPQKGQSEIIINGASSARSVVIWVNDAIAAHLQPRSTEKIIVDNGRNIIEAAETYLENGQWVIGERKQIVVSSRSNSVILRLILKDRALDKIITQEITVIGRGWIIATSGSACAH